MSEFLTPEQREEMPVAAAMEDNCVALCEELEGIINRMNVLAAEQAWSRLFHLMNMGRE